MQGRQNLSNMERKGPHKSMHCKFCKPPGDVNLEKPTRAQMETKTNIHLAHEAADLRLCNISNEPGFPIVESEACICVLEGEKICPKCVPDKKVPPVKKKKCQCPKGAKPHPSMYEDTSPAKRKEQDEDDEFWWEKYSREHDAITRETWAAYMAQRRKEKKLLKCQKREETKRVLESTKGVPEWYRKLSCQQMIYIEFLSTAIRLDSDENITDRTFFVLGGLGLYPRPRRKILKKCLRYCHYNSIHFLKQLYLLTKNDDPYNEKYLPPSLASKITMYTWNEMLIMNSICHLEFPMLLREIMERLPPFPRDKLLPQIPYPVFPKIVKKKYDDPYEEPIWQDRINWIEKMKIDRLNRCRAYMDTKRVKIPPLALVRRPSLIDARPPFLALIEANERSNRRIVKEKKKVFRKHPISTFNSAVDVTAIAGIEASEISTTDKADTDEICVFLREPLKEPESVEEEEEKCTPEKEVKFEEENLVTTEISKIKSFSEFGELSSEENVIEFKTPPKTESGTTIKEPCPPPIATPGPPAPHYDAAVREIEIITEEGCKFQPYVSSSSQTVKPKDMKRDSNEITTQLMSAAEKLKKFADEEEEEDTIKEKSKKAKKSKLRRKCRRRKNKRSCLKKKKKSIKEPCLSEEIIEIQNEDKQKDEEEEEGEVVEEVEMQGEGFDFGFDFDFSRIRKPEKKVRKKESQISDPDPGSDDQWSARPPCTPEVLEVEEEKIVKKKRRLKRKINRRKCKKRRKTKVPKKEKPEKIIESKMMELPEETGDYFKKREPKVKVDKETMTECYEGEYDHLYEGESQPDEKKKEPEEVSLFTGDRELLLVNILQDLADEGYISASYANIHQHPDIAQLIKYLTGEILTSKKRKNTHEVTRIQWANMKGPAKFNISELGISSKTIEKATWNDKKWISRLANYKKDEFYFKVASSRAQWGKKIYSTLAQEYFGTGRYLKIFYSYMTSKYEDAILRGID